MAINGWQYALCTVPKGHGKLSRPQGKKIPKGSDVMSIDCILFTMATPVPSTMPGPVGVLHLWNE